MTDTGTQANGDGGFTDPAAVYNHLEQCAEQLAARDPAALDQILDAIFSTGSLSDAERMVLLSIVRKKSGLTVQEFNQVVRPFEARRRNGNHPPEETVETPEERAARRAEAWAKCRHLAEDPDLIFGFIKDVQSWGIDGEVHAIIATHLVHTSRLLDRPASLLRKGAPSSGKSAVVGAVLHFSNEGDDWIGITAGSARSLVYKNGGVKHKTLYFMEAAGIATRSNGDEDPVGYMMRSLLSENCIKYQTVEEQKDPRTGRTAKVGRDIVLAGPTNAIITTARENVEEEMATRLLLSYADESEKRTRAVIRRVFSPPAKPSDDRADQWRALQTWLRLGPKKVVIPFGEDLAEMIATGQLRMRRDAASVRALIEASALLHQAQRGRDGEAIVAAFDDYVWAEAATSSGLDAIAAGSEVDTAAVATAIERLLRTERRRFVQHEAARLLAARLSDRLYNPAPTTILTPTQKALTRLSASAAATYDKVKAVAATGGLAIRAQDLRAVLAMAQLRGPTTLRISGRRLAQVLGVTYKIARLRLRRAIEDGVVVDETPPGDPRNNPAGRMLRPGHVVQTRSSGLKRAIPTYEALRSAWEQRQRLDPAGG